MSKEIRPGKMRLSINMPSSLFMDFKSLAIHKNMTLTEIVELSLMDYMNKNKELLQQNRSDKIKQHIEKITKNYEE